MRAFRFFVLATAIAAGALFSPGAASAHDLRAKVTVADAVRVEAYFDGDVPAEFAEVIVTNEAGAEVLKGKTDERGVWTFPRPSAGEYMLKVKSIGHAAQVLFRVDGAEDAPPVVYAPWRMNKALALALGLVLLLGLSAVSWFRRRRR